jgi:hypothetical protein
MMISNIKHWDFFDYHLLVWSNTKYEFKYIKIDNKLYKKYSIYIGKFIFEIGRFKYGTNNKSVPTISK